MQSISINEISSVLVSFDAGRVKILTSGGAEILMSEYQLRCIVEQVAERDAARGIRVGDWVEAVGTSEQFTAWSERSVRRVSKITAEGFGFDAFDIQGIGGDCVPVGDDHIWRFSMYDFSKVAHTPDREADR